MGHAIPHAPQFAGSCATSVHTPPQRISPGPHCGSTPPEVAAGPPVLSPPVPPVVGDAPVLALADVVADVAPPVVAPPPLEPLLLLAPPVPVEPPPPASPQPLATSETTRPNATDDTTDRLMPRSLPHACGTVVLMRTIVALSLLLSVVACERSTRCPDEQAQATTSVDVAPCRPDAGGFTSTVDNPFFPLPAGRVWTYEGASDGEAIRLVITVLPDKRVVAGVETQVVEEREWEDGALVEVSRNFFAQAADGTVCYFGEEVDLYENDAIVGHDGAWSADTSGAAPGVVMPPAPKTGQWFAQEVAPGVAEDHARITDTGAAQTVPAGAYTDTVSMREWTPLEPCQISTKVYARGVGMIVDDEANLTKIEG